MSSENKVKQIEEALKTSKIWKFENAEIEIQEFVDVDITQELRLDLLFYVLAHDEMEITYNLNSLFATWHLTKCNLYWIDYEIKGENKLRALIYRIYIQIIIKIIVEIDVQQGIINIEQINLFEP